MCVCVCVVLTRSEKIVAPATGTPETGGWSTRELRTILRGLDGINLIAADIVEVAVSVFFFLEGPLLPDLLLPRHGRSVGPVISGSSCPVTPGEDFRWKFDH